MNRFILISFIALAGCASVSRNPKDYNWYAQYKDGSKLTAFVEWFDDSTGCVGSSLYVPKTKDIQSVPIRIVRIGKDGKEKEFHMCSENKNPDYLEPPPFNYNHQFN